MLMESRLESLLSRYSNLTIGLLGDLFLDRYLHIEPGVHELSIETGLEAYQVTRVRNSPGALGTVMNNLAALGVGKLVPITVIGHDGHGFDLLQQVQTLPADTSFILSDARRLTPTYTKPMKADPNGHAVELNRLDFRNRCPLEPETSEQLCERLRSAFRLCDGLIVLDQIVESDWGVVNSQVRNTLIDLHREFSGKLVFVDSRAHLSAFAGGVLKGNRSEILCAAGGLATDDAAVKMAAMKLAARTRDTVFCTMGEAGILVARSDSCELVPGFPEPGPVDIVGAGDAATSGIVTALLAGATHVEAAVVGNLVASITVQQIGTTGTASPSQVRDRLRKRKA